MKKAFQLVTLQGLNGRWPRLSGPGLVSVGDGAVANFANCPSGPVNCQATGRSLGHLADCPSAPPPPPGGRQESAIADCHGPVNCR